MPSGTGRGRAGRPRRRPASRRSAVREEVSTAAEARRSGLSEAEWMARSYPYIQELLKSGEYPIFTKIVTEASRVRLSRDEQFRYGLERVLDCIAAALPPTAVPTHREGRQDRAD
ncbi:MAG: hypothetical protein GEV11_07540 [Streptosporangiales bacterium]|nr:hypothetical protein [Streptosporangiales bacterium]